MVLRRRIVFIKATSCIRSAVSMGASAMAGPSISTWALKPRCWCFWSIWPGWLLSVTCRLLWMACLHLKFLLWSISCWITWNRGVLLARIYLCTCPGSTCMQMLLLQRAAASGQATCIAASWRSQTVRSSQRQALTSWPQISRPLLSRWPHFHVWTIQRYAPR